MLAWSQANQEAWQSGSTRIEPIHLLMGILLIIDGLYGRNPIDYELSTELEENIREISNNCLKLLNLTADELTKIRRQVQKAMHLEIDKQTNSLLHRSTISKRIFSDASVFALEQRSKVLSIDHLTKVILDILPCSLVDLPGFLNKNKTENREGWAINSSFQYFLSEYASENNILKTIGRDLTHLASAGKLNKIIGREREILEILRILLRTTKRNVILIGEPGVGKTAVVEGLAQRLVSGSVPVELKKIRIVQIAVSDLVAGTIYRGSMEGRLKELIQTIEKFPGTVLFLDEIHLAIQSGNSVNGSMDVANILKPALTRETFPCIGATTTIEYNKFLATDEAFRRRFHVIKIEEPDYEQTFDICKSWAVGIEKAASVLINDEAIRNAIELSNQFILDRNQPDKAIDLLEDAAASLRMKFIENATNEKGKVVDRKLIKDLLEERLGIKLDGRFPDFIQIQNALIAKTFIQADVLDQLSYAFNEIHSKNQSSINSNFVFLFQGPIRCGKTEVAQIIADELSPKSSHTLKINLADYRQDQDITRLTGVPPGFIGYDQESPLLKFASSTPQGIILVQNVEQGSQPVQELLAQIQERKEFVDAKGRKACFRNHLWLLINNTSTYQESPKLSKELLRQCQWTIEFSKIELQEYTLYFDQLYKNLSDDLLNNSCRKIDFDESSRVNTIIYLSEITKNKQEFNRLFEQQVGKPIIRFTVKNKGVEHIKIMWTHKGLEISAT